ncbi:lipid A deacylase LpxR family protein [Pedobacter glucosidilyticus]|uniref:lipid A deacylase LpxR family protein n=1 Tax=Pedobacter glucosidilyticus TaxID=1122941 RepID=UPI0026EFB29A|nr:lipid A deacylase LpxR family protein [Pedobacter glucosidilyticus]
MKKIFACLWSLLFIKTIIVQAQETNYKYEFGFRSENDAYLAIGQDQYYTNGLFLNFRSAINPAKTQDTSKLVKKIWALSIAHKMYNAASGNIRNIASVDRPFAAYAYGAASLNYYFKKETILGVELQGGILGPSAKGEEGQKFYHEVFGFYDINGWQFQVKDEIGVNLLLNYQSLLYRNQKRTSDFSLPVEARIGNTFTGLKAGVLFRTGTLNPLYHSMATNSFVSTYKEAQAKEKELYFFLKPSLDVVIYDATISGGLFREDKGPVVYDVKPLVFSQELGVAFAQKRWTFNFSLIFKSKELKSSAKAHQYGVIDLYYRFN